MYSSRSSYKGRREAVLKNSDGGGDLDREGESRLRAFPWNCWHSVDTDGDAGSTLVWHVDTVKLIGSQELVVPLEELGYNRGTARWLLATGTQWERGDTGESSRWNLLGKVVSGSGEIAQWVKVLDTKPNNLSSIPWTLMVEKENQLCHLTSTYPLWYTLPQHTYAH